MGIFNPPGIDRGDIQKQAFDTPEDFWTMTERSIKRKNPNAVWNADEQRKMWERDHPERAQGQQADMLRSQAQQPTADGQEQPEGPSRFRTNSDLFPESVLKQVAGERNISEAGMSPANITPGAKSVGKGGVITDADMNMGAAGSALNAQGAGVSDQRVVGRREFKRMARFYGR